MENNKVTYDELKNGLVANGLITNDSEEAAAEQSLIPAIEIAPVTGVDSLDKTELKLEMS